MEVNDVRPIQSVARVSDRQSNGYDLHRLQNKSRHQFSRISDDEDGVVYQLLDEETGMILTQVPSEEVLRVAKHLQQMLSDRKAK